MFTTTTLTERVFNSFELTLRVTTIANNKSTLGSEYMKKLNASKSLALVISLLAISASAMNYEPWPQVDSKSKVSIADRVVESGLGKHLGVIAFVSDMSKSGKSFEKAYFGRGGQGVYEASMGMYVQIISPEDAPGGARVGDILALTADGKTVLSTMRDYPSMDQYKKFIFNHYQIVSKK